MKLIITRVGFRGKPMREDSLDCVKCYYKLRKHADYVLSAKQRPKNFKRSDDVYFFSKS